MAAAGGGRQAGAEVRCAATVAPATLRRHHHCIPIAICFSLSADFSATAAPICFISFALTSENYGGCHDEEKFFLAACQKFYERNKFSNRLQAGFKLDWCDAICTVSKFNDRGFEIALDRRDRLSRKKIFPLKTFSISVQI